MEFPELNVFLAQLEKRHPGEKEFHQAVQEVFEDVFPFVEDYPDYKTPGLPERLTEPDRCISFRVCWEDDHHRIQVNRGFRVQFSNVLGPYKGGLRFHPSVNLSIMKFLAFEQVFKNSLLPFGLGGAKGGADFNPKGRSRGEIRRFCQSFMTELMSHIGVRKDVPAGDAGVGERELGFLFGQYKKLGDDGAGILTGKNSLYGGSQIRPEATGYGCVYFAENMLAEAGEGLKDKVCALSGSGNVAIYAAEKLQELGARVVSLSDSSGTLYDKNGLSENTLSCIKGLKFQRYGRLSEVAYALKCQYLEADTPWHLPCDIAFPCATQNELGKPDAEVLVRNGCRWVLEGANMPVTREGAEVFKQSHVTLVPGKAANAGGVAVSGLEMAQNATGLPWKRAEVDHKLREIMGVVHANCLNYGKNLGTVDYVKGANLAAFVRVAKSLKDQDF